MPVLSVTFGKDPDVPWYTAKFTCGKFDPQKDCSRSLKPHINLQKAQLHEPTNANPLNPKKKKEMDTYIKQPMLVDPKKELTGTGRWLLSGGIRSCASIIPTRKYQSLGEKYTFERNSGLVPVSECQASWNASSACVPHQMATMISPEQQFQVTSENN